jgi:TonB family protein
MLAHVPLSTAILLIICAVCPAQSPGHAENGEIRVSKLIIPAYPALAQHARIAGDMDVTLTIGGTGQVEAAVIDRGPALLELRQAVLDAARESQFECLNCGKEQSYSLRYAFEVKPSDPEKYCHAKGQIDPPPASVDINRHQVTVYTWEEWTCDPRVEITKFRAAKCVYLWKCGHHERALD